MKTLDIVPIIVYTLNVIQSIFFKCNINILLYEQGITVKGKYFVHVNWVLGLRSLQKTIINESDTAVMAI